ncbi:MAG: hypothetical protein GEV08_20675 [Acidimicrobiia bacterium]|nr:hypothetical protein [Acidimicrobiia bacterium]
MAEYSLLELASRLAADPGEKAIYQTDPPGYLDARGYGELSPGELRDALGHVADSVPPELAAVIDPSAGLDQLASADLAELGLDELHGIPVEDTLDDELEASALEAFDADPGELDALEVPDSGPGPGPDAARHDTDVDGTDVDGTDGDDDLARTAGEALGSDTGGTVDEPGTGADSFEDELTAAEPAVASSGAGFAAPEDPFAELDDDIDEISPDTTEPLEAGLEGPETLWEDFDV